jgi:hypothetical protein
MFPARCKGTRSLFKLVHRMREKRLRRGTPIFILRSSAPLKKGNAIERTSMSAWSMWAEIPMI